MCLKFVICLNLVFPLPNASPPVYVFSKCRRKFRMKHKSLSETKCKTTKTHQLQFSNILSLKYIGLCEKSRMITLVCWGRGGEHYFTQGNVRGGDGHFILRGRIHRIQESKCASVYFCRWEWHIYIYIYMTYLYLSVLYHCVSSKGT